MGSNEDKKKQQEKTPKNFFDDVSLNLKQQMKKLDEKVDLEENKPSNNRTNKPNSEASIDPKKNPTRFSSSDLFDEANEVEENIFSMEQKTSALISQSLEAPSETVKKTEDLLFNISRAKSSNDYVTVSEKVEKTNSLDSIKKQTDTSASMSTIQSKEQKMSSDLPTEKKEVITEEENEKLSQTDAESSENKDEQKDTPESNSDDEQSEVNPESSPSLELESVPKSERPTVVIQQIRKSRPSALEQRTQGLQASDPKSTIELEDIHFCLEQILNRSEDRILWLATTSAHDEEQHYLAEELSPERYRKGFYHLNKVEGSRVLFPDYTHEQEDRTFIFFKQRSGYRLNEKIYDPSQRWDLDRIEKLILQVAEQLKAIHKSGYLFLQLDAHHILMEDDLEPMFVGVEKLYHPKTPFHLRPQIEGFSPPEMFHQGLSIGAFTDIFSLGLLLFYAISNSEPFQNMDVAYLELPSPRIFNPDFPVGLDTVMRRACHPDPEQRYQQIDEFVSEFQHAIVKIKKRQQSPPRKLKIALGHDIHIGINKGLRNPINQDALFWRYDHKRGKGLFIVADGVSHCEYGSGDRASSLVIQAARKRWETLSKKPLMDQPLSHRQRAKIIQSIFIAANDAICREINHRYDRVDGYVEDVMGSTCVAAFLDGNRLTVANLGDSRGYLKTEETIEQITVDHDYKNAQLQAFQDLRALSSLSGGSLITRCVGSFAKDEKLKIHPQPMDTDFFEVLLQTGDIVLLCSDGLSDYSAENEEESRQVISHLLHAYPEPTSACFWLLALANQNGGGDNISLLEIKVLS